MANKTYIEDLHTEDLEEIIAKPPTWLMKRGISFIFLTILIIIGLSVFIRYPEMVTVKMKFNTSNSPKALVSKINGTIVRILTKEGEWVNKGADIAYLESTADHKQVILVLDKLKSVRNNIKYTIDLESFVSPSELELGELQGSYQQFYLTYLTYRAVASGGILQKRKGYLQNETKFVNDQNNKILQTYDLQKQELALTESEFEKYKMLAEKKVISPMELQQKEAQLLSKRQAIPQIENNIINNRSNLLSKDKELAEIENQIVEEQKRFSQSLNTFISDAENWKKQYVITSSSNGYLVYGDFLQENQLVKVGEVLFYINADQNDYHGEILIPQGVSSRVKKNQDVQIKVRSYPYQEYGYLKGKVEYISEIPVKDSLFFSRVKLVRTKRDSVIKLKPGIIADAEIITEDQSIFKRIWLNVTKSITH